MRAGNLHDIFPEYQDVKSLFDLAFEIGPHEAYLYQQFANYERKRPNGNLENAERLLQMARELDPRDNTILHTLAEVKRTAANNSATPLEKDKLRNEARVLLRPLMESRHDDEYACHTLVKLALDELKEELESDSATDSTVDAQIRQVEESLQVGFQRHPNAEYLLVAESEYSQLLKDDARSIEALRRAFASNKRDPFVASRLARVCLDQDNISEARNILYAALDANPGSPRLHFQYAEVLRIEGAESNDTLLYHYRRSFTKGDRNYEAQFWFARYAFESPTEDVRAESKEVFRGLRGSPLAYQLRYSIRDRIGSSGAGQVFSGNIARLDYAIGSVRRDGEGDLIFIHINEVGEDTWIRLAAGVRVTFSIGFTMNGAQAIELSLID